MKKFIDILLEKDTINLCESPQRMKGNAPFEEISFSTIATKSKSGVERDYNLYKSNFVKVNNENLDLYKSKTHNYFILGRFYKETETEERFAIIFDVSFRENKLKSKQKQLNNKSAIIIETVHTAKDYRDNKIARTFYQTILEKYIIISDQIQYEGAVYLWKRLIKENVVYTYDILDDKIISKVSEKTPENHIWSDNESKRRIRLVAIPE